MIKKLQKFISDFEASVIPLAKMEAETYFKASISGKKEDFQKAAEYELLLKKIYSDPDDFNTLKNIIKSGKIKNLQLKRQLQILYNDCLGMQIEPTLLEEIVKLQTVNEEKFSVFRAEVNAKKLTDNQIDDILKTSVDSNELENVWIASKKIGDIVANDVIKLVKMRNKAARLVGFDNYHIMSLELNEQDIKTIDNLFDQLDTLTSEAYKRVKAEIDDNLKFKFQIKSGDLMPWHYHDRFFQHAPPSFDMNLDKYYENRDLEKLTADYFRSLDLPVDDMIQNSDLYEKTGKYQHAYCTDIDREGDIRVVCNIKSNVNWMGTMLHEFGHAVYDKYIRRDLPWLLRTHAHVFATEAIAMLFGRMAYQADWINKMLPVPENEMNMLKQTSQKLINQDAIVFSHWAQVMYRFEKMMYQDPEQDLDKLWWQLVSKYQMLKKPRKVPANSWASKIHLALYPAYYHNYMLGELLASQLLNKIHQVTDSDIHSQKTGRYLKQHFFAPGASLKWDELIKQSTEEQFTAEYFAADYIA